MLVKDRVASETDVPKKMAGFLVAESLDALFLDEPIAAFVPSAKTGKPFPKLQAAITLQEISRFLDVARPFIGITVNTCQRTRKFFPRSGQKHRSDRFDRPHSHPRRTAGRKETEHHFFPKVAVAPLSPNGLEL